VRHPHLYGHPVKEQLPALHTSPATTASVAPNIRYRALVNPARRGQDNMARAAGTIKAATPCQRLADMTSVQD
jgi:hypothetical protein